MIIKADTPEELQRELLKWLEDQACAHGRAARIAKRKTVINEELNKSNIYRFAAEFVGKMKIEPRLTLGKDNFAGTTVIFEADPNNPLYVPQKFDGMVTIEDLQHEGERLKKNADEFLNSVDKNDTITSEDLKAGIEFLRNQPNELEKQYGTPSDAAKGVVQDERKIHEGIHDPDTCGICQALKKIGFLSY